MLPERSFWSTGVCLLICSEDGLGAVRVYILSFKGHRIAGSWEGSTQARQVNEECLSKEN